MSTEPGDITPQLPPAAKPTLPPAPKLSLAGSAKPAFKPDAPTLPTLPAAPTITTGLTPPPALRPPAATPATAAPTAAPAPVAASRAPVIQAHKTSLASVKAVEDSEVPAWHAALSGFGLVASIVAVTLLFLELKPTL